MKPAVKLYPPASLMVKCADELPKRTDPSLGGGINSYIETARQYHNCKLDQHGLIDWVDRNIVKERDE